MIKIILRQLVILSFLPEIHLFIAPCGAIANSLFNDTFFLYDAPAVGDALFDRVRNPFIREAPVPMTGKDIAWQTDKVGFTHRNKFSTKNLDSKVWSRRAYCKQFILWVRKYGYSKASQLANKRLDSRHRWGKIPKSSFVLVFLGSTLLSSFVWIWW